MRAVLDREGSLERIGPAAGRRLDGAKWQAQGMPWGHTRAWRQQKGLAMPHPGSAANLPNRLPNRQRRCRDRHACSPYLRKPETIGLRRGDAPARHRGGYAPHDGGRVRHRGCGHAPYRAHGPHAQTRQGEHGAGSRGLTSGYCSSLHVREAPPPVVRRGMPSSAGM